MSVQVKTTPQSLIQKILDVFLADPTVKPVQRVEGMQLRLEDLNAFPKCTRLLLAHSLQQKDPNLMLLKSDHDADPLVSNGWLKSVPCSTKGVNCFEFEPHIWNQISMFHDELLSRDLLSSLVFYRKRKSALYPWIWN